MYNSQLLKGILEGCILKIISNKKTYGYEISEKLKEFGFIDLASGTLYPLLIRLEKKKYITSELVNSPLGPKRKYYILTDNGEIFLKNYTNQWNDISNIVNNILYSKD
jgi:PadR family transcriptional regulator PadR